VGGSVPAGYTGRSKPRPYNDGARWEGLPKRIYMTFAEKNAGKMPTLPRPSGT